LVAENTAKQVAWGIALGVLIGFVPKGNLLAIGLAAILFSLRVNLLSALVTMAACSAVGMLLDPFFDHMGRTILTIIPLQGLFARIYQWPFVPWTAFNNTVVMGAFFVGILQLYPTYRIARRLARRNGDVWGDFEGQQSAHGVIAADVT
jgi:uncharacterized protein (TIGR03546 family)